MNKDFIKCRPAIPSDLPTLADIWHDGWIEAHRDHVPQSLTTIRTHESFAIRLAENLANTIVFGPIGAPLGFISVKGSEIYQLFIAPKGRGTGAAQSLMLAAIDRLRQAGHKRITLDVIPENKRAIAVYTKIGWQSTGVHTVMLDTLDDPYPLKCVVMSMDL